jgi:hypothetical protein
MLAYVEGNASRVGQVAPRRYLTQVAIAAM